VFPDQVACGENLTGEIRIPDQPLVNETIDNCLHEAMDADGLIRLLDDIQAGRVRTVAIDDASPSPFSHEILSANPYAFLDDVPLEERRARAVQLRSTLRTDFVGGAGVLDPAVIVRITEEVWPDVRNADELHDALLSLITLPPVAEWQAFFEELRSARRVSVISRGGREFWVAAERLGSIDDYVLTVRGWMESLGPITAGALAEKLALSGADVERALLTLEAEGQVLRGRFSVPEGAGEMQWCNRRVLARIHRATLGDLRREIEPVSALDFHRFLCRWQHMVPGSQLHGPDGVLQMIRQLQGYEIAASAWEPEILGRRIAKYKPEYLDELCLSGEVMWGRLSAHPAMEDESGRRVRATRIAPISFFLRESVGWLADPQRASEDAQRAALSHSAHDVLGALAEHGASFFADLTLATGRLASEVEDALWELVAAGLVTADGFENLRALIDPKRRRGEGRARERRPRHAAGRWALMRRSLPLTLPADRVEAFADQLLLRWGVLFRDLLTRETTTPFWRDLLPVLRRREARGELRGGRFVSGLSGEQFASAEALDLLRAVRRAEAHPEDDVRIANADPLNLAGIILPGPRVSTMTIGSRLLTAVPVGG